MEGGKQLTYTVIRNWHFILNILLSTLDSAKLSTSRHSEQMYMRELAYQSVVCIVLLYRLYKSRMRLAFCIAPSNSALLLMIIIIVFFFIAVLRVTF